MSAEVLAGCDRHALYASLIEPLAKAVAVAERAYSDALFPDWETLDEMGRDHLRREAGQILRVLLDNPDLAESIVSLRASK